MRLYLLDVRLSANSDDAAADARQRQSAVKIADLILPHIENDPALFAMWHKGEIACPTLLPDACFGDANVVRISGRDALRAALIEAGDPLNGHWMLIRSLVTCRAVLFGADGQAFVCLSSNDDPIESSDPAICVEERPSILTDTDYMDGLYLDQ
jgi:hypothetical protein